MTTRPSSLLLVLAALAASPTAFAFRRGKTQEPGEVRASLAIRNFDINGIDQPWVGRGSIPKMPSAVRTANAQVEEEGATVRLATATELRGAPDVIVQRNAGRWAARLNVMVVAGGVSRAAHLALEGTGPTDAKFLQRIPAFVVHNPVSPVKIVSGHAR